MAAQSLSPLLRGLADRIESQIDAEVDTHSDWRGLYVMIPPGSKKASMVRVIVDKEPESARLSVSERENMLEVRAEE